MRQVILDATYMTNNQTTHEYIAGQLSFPEYYGRNLDALHDMLTQISQPTLIIIEHGKLLPTQLGNYGKILLDVLKDSAKENHFLHLKVD